MQHLTNGVKTVASQRTSHAKAEKKNSLAHQMHKCTKFGVRPMLLELDLSKREVLHLLAPLVSSYACEFMTYHHIRDVAAFRGYTSYFHIPRQKKKILWCQTYVIRTRPKQA